MTKEILLMQYQSECRSALKSVVNICKPFEKTFMDAMKLFMAILDRINFLQLGSYGRFSEQTYRILIHPISDGWKDRQVAAVFLYGRFTGCTRSSGLLQNHVSAGILL